MYLKIFTTVDGTWSQWGDLTCISNKWTKLRECNDPSPTNGGKHCHGNHVLLSDSPCSSKHYISITKGPCNYIMNMTNKTCSTSFLTFQLDFGANGKIPLVMLVNG